MNLINDFYTLTRRCDTDSGPAYSLSLNRQHAIYQAHFPGHPVTPGACIIQLCKELAELHTGEKLRLKKALNVKFLSIINPLDGEAVQVEFPELSPAGEGYRLSARVCAGERLCCKLSLYLQRLAPSLDEAMRRLGACLVIPAYNNEEALPRVLDEALRYTSAVIAVNDGSTDRSLELLEARGERIHLVSYPRNRGKGYALNRGFDRAEALGYTCAITMDADGQHSAADLPRFVEAIQQHPGSMVIGCRDLNLPHIPAGNRFANRFSNFWFAVQTGRRLPDTQTGFRLYPLGRMKRMRAFTPRYEAELELLVRSAWRNIRQVPIRIQVSYPPAGRRVTHFRPGRDFLRISLLNTLLVPLAVMYGYPSRFIRSIIGKWRPR